MQSTGAYAADRASALSGVPKSTIHYWARTELLVPSVSGSKIKLWSYADLMGLRIIYWLRQQKTDVAGAEVPATSMRAIRRALRRLAALEEPLWHPEQASIWIDPAGEIHVRSERSGDAHRARGPARCHRSNRAFSDARGAQGPQSGLAAT